MVIEVCIQKTLQALLFIFLRDSSDISIDFEDAPSAPVDILGRV